MTARHSFARSRTSRLAALALGVSAFAIASPAWAQEFTLNILHINDPHARVQPINRFNSDCSPEDDEASKCFGGFARLKTAIEERKTELSGPTLVVSAGDHFQGSLFYTTYKGALQAEMAGAIGIDLFALGNHEFDDGEEELAAFLDGVSFPVIGANVETAAGSAIEGRVDPYVIAEFGEERVAFIGVVASDTAETSSPGESISFGDDIEAVRRAVEAVEAEGVDRIVALTHIGLPRDRELAEAVPAIDVIVGGHSHTYLANDDEDAEGPYPTVVNDTPIVQAGAYGKYLGELTVTFDADGNVTSAEGAPILIDASVAKDEMLQARINELGGPIEELKAQVVGETNAPIDGERETCRSGECEMGNLVADAMLDRVRDQGARIAIQNGGGLRASIDEGEITMGEILTVLPFQNTLATFELSGADIVSSLENGVGQIEEGAGRFPQVAGLSFAFDPAAEPGSRVSNVQVEGEDGTEPIDPEATYLVVTNDFMRQGGDGYDLFASNGANAYDYGPGLEQVLADYIAANAPIRPSLDGRITDLSAASPAQSESGEVADAQPDPAAAIESINRSAEEEATASAQATDDEVAAAEPNLIDPAGDDAETDDAAAQKTDRVTTADASAAAINQAVDDTLPKASPLDEAPDVSAIISGEAADGTAATQDVEDTLPDNDPLEGAPDIETAAQAVEDGEDEAVAAINEAVDSAPAPGDALAEAPEIGVTDETEAVAETVEETLPDNDPLEGAPDVGTAAGAVEDDEDEAVAAINEAVDAAPTPGDALAEAPAIDAGNETDATATETVEETLPETDPLEGQPDVAAATEAEEDEENDAINQAVDAAPSSSDALAAAPEIEVTDETQAATQSVEETLPEADPLEGEPNVQEVAEAASEAETEAVAAINDAVDAAPAPSDALADAPTIAVPTEQERAEANAEAASGTEGVTETVEQTLPESDPLDGQPDVEVAAAAVEETENEAVAAINEAVDGATEGVDALADAPSIETADVTSSAGDGSAADATTETPSNAVQAADSANDGTEEEVEVAARANDASDGTAGDGTEPASPVAEAVEPDAEEPQEYVVQAGDTYWDLAERFYGNPRLHPVLEEANRAAARQLQVGARIVITPRP